VTLGTTANDLVERVRRDSLLASRGPLYTVGAGGYTSGQTSITLAETFTHIGQGSTLSIDYEMFYVQEATAATKTCTVIPGYFGTAQASHSAAAIVEVDARFPKPVLLDHMQQEIESWGQQLWRVSDTEIDLNVNERTYDLSGVAGQVYFLLDVRLRPQGTQTGWWNFSWTADAWPHLDADLIRRMDVADFASGTGIQLKHKPTHGAAARVLVAQPLDTSTFDEAIDLVSAVGMRQDWFSLLEAGVKARVLSSTVIGRSDWRTGTMARVAEEVSALDTVRTVQTFQQLRDLHLARAASDLRSDFPYRVF
jgi:hypothetical protein